MLPTAAVVFLVLFTTVIVFLIWPRPFFVITIRSGRIGVSRGKVPRRFLSECEEIVRAQGIEEGTISGVHAGRGVALRFGRSIPSHAHQAFRNVWSLYR